MVYESGKIEVEGITPSGGSDSVEISADFGAADWIRGGYTVDGEAQRDFHGWAFTGFGRGGAPASIQGNWEPLAGDEAHLPAAFVPDANGVFSGSYQVTEPVELPCQIDGTMVAVNDAFGAYQTSPVIDCDLIVFGGEGNEDEVEMFMAVMDAPDKPGEGTLAIVFLIFPREGTEIGLGAVFELTR